MFLKLIPPFFQFLSSIHPTFAGKLAYKLFVRPITAPVNLSESLQDKIAASLARAELETFHSSRGRIQLYHFEAGKEAPRALIVHGWTSNSEFMFTIAEAFHKVGFSVTCLDFPGHGRSPGAVLRGPDAVEIIREVRKHIGPIEVQLGHSFGGAMSMMSVRDELGEFCPSAPGHLITIAAPNNLDNVLNRFARIICLSQPALAALRRTVTQDIGEPTSNIDATTIAPIWVGALTVVHDEGDKEIPYDEAINTLKAIPDAELITTTGLGHRRILGDRNLAEKLAKRAWDIQHMRIGCRV